MKLMSLFFVLGLAAFGFVCSDSTSKEETTVKLFCPFNDHYLRLDKAYHECARGLSHMANGSCPVFLNELEYLLPEYDCRKSEYSEYVVPAIWLAGVAFEDYMALLYKLASNDEFYESARFNEAKIRAKEILLSPELYLALDGHMGEHYHPLINKMKYENP